MKSKIAICGDVHGKFEYLNDLIKKENPNMILQCGDFGYWPHYHGSKDFDGSNLPWDQYGIVNKSTEIYFCDGNHENHDELDKLKNNSFEPILVPGFKNVFYMQRGTVLNVNGKNILFFGGAGSIDKKFRIFGNSWWPQEEITRYDIDNLDESVKIDIIVSHTLPFKFSKYLNLRMHQSNSERWLNIVWDIYKPKKWYFGHFHFYKRFFVDNCEFVCLNKCDSKNWYEII